jgi:hypothetical protein
MKAFRKKARLSQAELSIAGKMAQQEGSAS